MATVLHSAPKITSNEGVKATLSSALGSMLVEAREGKSTPAISINCW